jgi:hypothetical protein
MQIAHHLGFALAAGLLLGGCARSYTPPEQSLLDPPGGVDSRSETSAPLDLAVAKPYGGLPEAGEQAPPGGIVIKGPDGSVWRTDTADPERQKAASEACYNYALAETRRDERINQDVLSARDTTATSLRFSDLRQRQTAFDLERRRDRLMASCMENKGYLRLDGIWDAASDPFNF